MKKLILTAVLSAASVAAFGQGTLDLANVIKNTFIAPIFQPNPASPTVQQVGQPSTAVYTGALPTGTTVYGGLPLTSGYDMVFLYSLNASATATSQLTVGTVTPFRTSPNGPVTSPAGGIVTVGGFAVPGTTGGTPISFQYAAFFVDPTVAAAAAQGGATPASIYAAALADFQANDPLAQFGYGSIVDNVALGGTDTAGTLHAPQTTGDGSWTSFSLIGTTATPEPSTIALAGLGAAGLLFFRRRK